MKVATVIQIFKQRHGVWVGEQVDPLMYLWVWLVDSVGFYTYKIQFKLTLIQ